MTIVKAKVYWPLVISASNQNVAIKLTGAPGTTYTAAIATGTYLSAVLLAAAVETAIHAVGGGTVFNNMVVSVSATGYFTFTDSLDPAFTLDWNRGGFTNSAGSLLGFYALAVASAANVATAPKQHTNGWYAEKATREDSLPIRDRKADTVTLALSGQTKYITESELSKRKLTFAFMTPEKTYIAFATGDYANQPIENWWADGRAKFRYWPDGATEATFVDYALGQNSIETFQPKRMFTRKALYEISFEFMGYVA